MVERVFPQPVRMSSEQDSMVFGWAVPVLAAVYCAAFPKMVFCMLEILAPIGEVAFSRQN